MSTTLTKWRVFCLTENGWTEGWLADSGGPPTSCFHNNEHNINVNSIQSMDTTQTLTVKVAQESIPTGGNYKTKGFTMDIVPSGVTTLAVSWPINITSIAVHAMSTVDNLGDTIDAVVAPYTPCGVITADHPASVNSVSVNSTVIANAKVGYECFVGSEFLGMITGIDVANLVVHFVNTTTVLHHGGTYFFIQRRIIENLPLGLPSGNDLGISSQGGNYLPAGIITHVIYTNNSNVAKKFSFHVEHLF